MGGAKDSEDMRALGGFFALPPGKSRIERNVEAVSLSLGRVQRAIQAAQAAEGLLAAVLLELQDIRDGRKGAGGRGD